MSFHELNAENFETLPVSEVIKRGSKSFSMASRLFSKRKRVAAHQLYLWCRYCDDAIDRSPLAKRPEVYSILRQQLEDCYNQKKVQSRAFENMQNIANAFSIPKHYPAELIEGMGMDAKGIYIRDEKELGLYCYRVAGVVGLMMSHIMGISSEQALRYACDMGIAMQLTNIARDIYEDALDGRIYLPEEWRTEFGILSPEDVLDPKNRSKVYTLVLRLLDRADSFYESGDLGIACLPFSAALAVSSARAIYSRIGTEIRNRGEMSLEKRVYTGTMTKIRLAVQCIAKVCMARLFGARVRARAIDSVWRYS